MRRLILWECLDNPYGEARSLFTAPDDEIALKSDSDPCHTRFSPPAVLETSAKRNRRVGFLVRIDHTDEDMHRRNEALGRVTPVKRVTKTARSDELGPFAVRRAAVPEVATEIDDYAQVVRRWVRQGPRGSAVQAAVGTFKSIAIAEEEVHAVIVGLGDRWNQQCDHADAEGSNAHGSPFLKHVKFRIGAEAGMIISVRPSLSNDRAARNDDDGGADHVSSIVQFRSF